jgi:hypothetical protein
VGTILAYAQWPLIGLACAIGSGSFFLRALLWRVLLGWLEQVVLGFSALDHFGRAATSCGLTLSIWIVDVVSSTVMAHALGIDALVSAGYPAHHVARLG